MPYPHSFEGRVEIPVASPDQPDFIKEGVERWLANARATDVQWDGDCLRFFGYRSFGGGMKTFPFRGVGKSEILFRLGPAKMAIEYCVRYRPYALLAPFAILPLLLAVSVTNGPGCLLILPFAALLHFGVWVLKGRDFQADFRLAAMRGLGDGAEREMNRLQAKWRDAGMDAHLAG